MATSQAAKVLWHDLDRSLRPAFQGGASWDEAISALEDKAAELKRLQAAGFEPQSFRRGERL